MTHKQTLCFGQVHRFLDGLFDGDLHAKRVLSLANATLGVISTASLAVNTIGCRPTSRCASWPTAGSATRSSTGC